MNNYLMLNNTRIDLTPAQVEEIKKSFGLGVIPLKDVATGNVVKIGNLEFVVLEHLEDGTTALLLKNLWKTAKFDNNSNDYSKSVLRKDLNENFCNVLSTIVGEENIVKHTVDLTSDDGRTDYGSCEDYISLLTCAMYRKYVYTLDKYRLDNWWWLATAYSTKLNGYDFSVRCVNFIGTLNFNNCDYDIGVRPFCIFSTSIFES